MASGSQNMTSFKARELVHTIKDNLALLRVFGRSDVGTSPNFDDPGFNGFFEVRNSSETTGESGTKPFNAYAGILTMKTPDNIAILQLAGSNGQGWWIRGKQSGSVTLNQVDWQRIVTNSGTWDIGINGNAATATKLTSNAGGTEQPIYFTDGKPAATTYALKATVNDGTAKYMAYYSDARTISGSSNIRATDNGTLSIFPVGGSYRDGIRIHARSSDNTWAAIMLCGADNTGDSGTSVDSWFLGANSGNLYFGKNGTGSSGTYLRCVSDTWAWNGTATGNISGNAGTATKLNSTGTTGQFWRGDNSWSNTLTEALLLPAGLKTGSRVNGSGSGVEIGDDGGIEIYHSTTPFIDFHYQASTADYSIRLICNSATELKCSTNFTAAGAIYANDGYLKSTKNSNTVTIGSQNTSYCHIENSANIPFWFNKTVQVNGNVVLYQQNTSLEPGYLHLGGATSATMTAASTNPRICFSEGASTQPVYLIYSDYDSYRAPAGLKIIGGASATPAWLEVEGQCYAAGFNGPLTGNVTGNCSGSSGSCTGNAATATKLKDNASNTTASFWRGDNSWSNTLVGPLYINSSTDVGKDQNGALIIGNKTGLNIGIDDNEIMARNNSAVSTLYLNNEGGQVQIGSGGLSVQGQIYGTWLRIVNNSSDNTDDAMVYLESKTTSDWALKINKGGKRYGVFIDSLDQDDALRTNGYVRARCIWANQGSNGERQVGVDSTTSGTLYFYANTTGKGIYSGSGYKTGTIVGITSSAVTFYGNCSGSSGSCTGNAATATTAAACTGNAATATSASYLSAPAVTGFTTDDSGNFTHKRTTNTDYWHLNKNGGNAIFSVYWETGNVTAAGTVTATAFSGPLTGNVTGNCSGSSGSCSGNAATATRINGNLTQATSDANRNIWVSSTTSADGIPNYVTTFTMNPSTKTLHIPSGGRIDANGGALYLGNSNNASWVYVQDMASQASGTPWKLTQAGVLTCVTVNANLTGNVTGNCSGSSGSCTGNAATASKVAWSGVTDKPTFSPVLLGTLTTMNATNITSIASYNFILFVLYSGGWTQSMMFPNMGNGTYYALEFDEIGCNVQQKSNTQFQLYSKARNFSQLRIYGVIG